MLANEKLIRLALEEDVGSGDVTTDGLVDPDASGHAVVFAKESLVVAGLSVACQVFTALDPAVRFELPVADGNQTKENDEILHVWGKLVGLLTAERTALNFLQRLSGIATLTRRYVVALEGRPVRITDTRKTTPGWRRLEKYAVRVGGASNHRYGLYDGILIKDNHIQACGGITSAVEQIRKIQGHMLRIEVEVTTLEEVKEALSNDVDIIMLDNMTLPEIKSAVTLVQGRAMIEVSGGVNLESVVNYASVGVDIVSVGALTHSARAVDMSMRILR